MTNPSESLELWYWVRGSPFSNVVSIKALPDTTIGALQEYIIQSCHLRVPSNGVCLYKVPQTHPVSLQDSGYDVVLGGLSISGLGQPLRVPQKLASIFTMQPEKDHLHLILDITTSLPITCWIRGAGPTDHFPVELPKSERLDLLKVKAKEMWPRFIDVPVPFLRLYKVSFRNSDDLVEILDNKGEGDLIPANQRVENAFGDIPFSSAALNVVIEAASRQSERYLARSDLY
ncbi:hypothetical protein HD554DRAFT_2041830 [Boletus coccyginus]|nr:hypothetical protein HD554DRAFT_2041830 [Boletus coccyginus]